MKNINKIKKKRFLYRSIGEKLINNLLINHNVSIFLVCKKSRKNAVYKIINYPKNRYTLPLIKLCYMLIIIAYLIFILFLCILCIDTCQTINYNDIIIDCLDFNDDQYYAKESVYDYVKNINKSLSTVQVYKNYTAALDKNVIINGAEYDKSVMNEINKLHLKQIMSENTAQQRILQLESQINDNKMTYYELIKDIGDIIKEMETKCKSYY